MTIHEKGLIGATDEETMLPQPINASLTQFKIIFPTPLLGFAGDSVIKNLPAMQETQVWSLGREDLLEKEMATHSSILAWEIPWTEDPRRLQSMELQRVEYNLATKQYSVVMWNFKTFNILVILFKILCSIKGIHLTIRNIFPTEEYGIHNHAQDMIKEISQLPRILVLAVAEAENCT